MRLALTQGGALALARLDGAGASLRLVAQFDNHAYLQQDGPEAAPRMLILARPGQPRGALDLVPETWADWAGLCSGTGALKDGEIRFDKLVLSAEGAVPWPSALPDGAPSVAVLRQAAGTLAHGSALLQAVLAGAGLPDGTRMLARGLERVDLAALAEGSRALAGLGPGLTPAGDDFLCGVLIAARARAALCDVIACAARDRTTMLSHAFIEAAAEGHGSEAWRALLVAGDTALPRCVAQVAAPGASSGADTLAGYIWARELAAAWAAPVRMRRR